MSLIAICFLSGLILLALDVKSRSHLISLFR